MKSKQQLAEGFKIKGTTLVKVTKEAKQNGHFTCPQKVTMIVCDHSTYLPKSSLCEPSLASLVRRHHVYGKLTINPA